MEYGDGFVLTLFTNDPAIAREADRAGIDRIGLDLEQLGKSERQAGLKTWISDHRIEDLSRIRAALAQAALFVRTNPVHDRLSQEIENYLAERVRVLMLPMFHSAYEAATFLDLVGGRAKTVLLCETPAAAVRLHEVVCLPGIDEIHIGLNDLRLGLGLRSHFELLASDLMDSIAGTVRDAGLPLGIAGVGRVGDEHLPIPPDLVFSQLIRLGASRSLVSRAFFPADGTLLDLPREVQRVRNRLSEWARKDQATLLLARDRLRSRLQELFDERRAGSVM